MNAARYIGDGDIELTLEIKVIGWCVREGTKQLVTDIGTTMGTRDLNISIDETIEKLQTEASKKGLSFPEFTWNGSTWEEKIG